MASQQYNPLTSLLLALFEASELERFIRNYYGRSLSHILARKGSSSLLVEELVEDLEQAGKVDQDLFEYLLESRPDQRELIIEVRDTVLADDENTEDNQGIAEESASKIRGIKPTGNKTTSEIDDARLAWRAKMENLLKDAPVEQSTPENWLDAVAVLPSFRPTEVKPLDSEMAGESNDPLTLLAEDCDTLVDGSWSLKLPLRQQAIARLWKMERLKQSLKANPDDHSPHRALLQQIAKTGQVDLNEIEDYEQLLAVREVADWFSQSSVMPVDLDRLTVRLEWRQRIEPLRELIGKHFRGRVDELDKLNQHAQGKVDDRVLTVWGLGGVGKSTLLGKFLLDLDPSTPWVYLDFDDPEVDPTNPKRLIEIIARNLGLYYNGTDLAQDLASLESASAGDDLSFTLEVANNASTSSLLKSLDKIVRQQPLPEPALLIVFDTFEQVQVRGSSVVVQVKKFLQKLTKTLPYAQVVVSGRAQAGVDNSAEIGLQDLDSESADAVLKALGVTKKKLRRKIIGKFGTSPLSLRLAAEAINKKQLSEEDIEEFLVEARKLELQGQLYTRILGHIQDGDVRRLAHPGLIVRRVTPDIIRHVLAEACDLNPDLADELFSRLQDHLSLFEPDPANKQDEKALLHRQDVRESMLGLMHHDPAWKHKLREIHDLAVAYYQGKGDSVSRAEQLYHRVMRDDDPIDLDPLWSPKLSDSLARCWQEPIPPRARNWLGPRLGLVHEDSDSWRTVDWEIAAYRDTQELLHSDDPKAALKILKQRKERSEGSSLFWIEAEARRQLGQFNRAIKVCEKGIKSASDAYQLSELMKLHLLAAEIYFQQGEGEATRQHAERAARVANQLDDAAGNLAAQEVLLRADNILGKKASKEQNKMQLERIFVQTQDVDLRSSDTLIKQILKTAGSESKPILRKAAVAFGNRAEQNLIKQDAFQLEDLLSYASKSKAGMEGLTSLASAVGLSKNKFKMFDLAQSAIRHGMLGDAIANVLDSVGDQKEVQKMAHSMFKENVKN